MARRKNRGNEKGQAIAKLIIEQYQPQNKEEMQDAIKDVFGPMLEAMLQGEMDNHLGYTSNDHGSKDTDNRRNGYIGKTVRRESSMAFSSFSRKSHFPVIMDASFFNTIISASMYCKS